MPGVRCQVLQLFLARIRHEERRFGTGDAEPRPEPRHFAPARRSPRLSSTVLDRPTAASSDRRLIRPPDRRPFNVETVHPVASTHSQPARPTLRPGSRSMRRLRAMPSSRAWKPRCITTRRGRCACNEQPTMPGARTRRPASPSRQATLPRDAHQGSGTGASARGRTMHWAIARPDLLPC